MSDLLDSALLSGLLARSALKDQQAFADLYRRTSPKLLGMALRILHRQDWAEEVLQESFVSIWQHAGDYTAAKSAPVTWMTSIVRNRALDFLRRPREELPGEFEAMLEVIADETPGLLDGLAERDEARSLVRCLETLEAEPAADHRPRLLSWAHAFGAGRAPQGAPRNREDLGAARAGTSEKLFGGDGNRKAIKPNT